MWREKRQRQDNHLVRRQEGMKLSWSSEDGAEGLDLRGAERHGEETVTGVRVTKGDISTEWL